MYTYICARSIRHFLLLPCHACHSVYTATIYNYCLLFPVRSVFFRWRSVLRLPLFHCFRVPTFILYFSPSSSFRNCRFSPMSAASCRHPPIYSIPFAVPKFSSILPPVPVPPHPSGQRRNHFKRPGHIILHCDKYAVHSSSFSSCQLNGRGALHTQFIYKRTREIYGSVHFVICRHLSRASAAVE